MAEQGGARTGVRATGKVRSAPKRKDEPKTGGFFWRVSDKEIEDTLYIKSDERLAAYHQIPVERVRKVRGAATPRAAVNVDLNYGGNMQPPGVEVREAHLRAKRGSQELLRRLLQYGLRHDRDLGLGADRFHQLAAEHGVRA